MLGQKMKTAESAGEERASRVEGKVQKQSKETERLEKMIRTVRKELEESMEQKVEGSVS